MEEEAVCMYEVMKGKERSWRRLNTNVQQKKKPRLFV
jgi:hypothetical protein